MRSSGIRRGMAPLILCFFEAACAAPNADRRAAARDPGAPAVIQAPPVVLPGDAMRTGNALVASAVTLEVAQRTIASGFAVLDAAIVFGDRRTIAASFAPDAEVSTPGSTYRGVRDIANGLARLGSSKSLREFRRRSLVTRVVDSTVIDSGTYLVLTKRPGADSVLEKGHYATRWRILAPPQDWQITRDRLYADLARKAK